MNVQNFVKEELEKAGIEIPDKEAIDSLIATIEASFFKICEVLESSIVFIRQNAADFFNELRQAFDEAHAEIDERKSGYIYKKNDIYFENKKCLLKQTKCLNLCRFNKHLIRHKLIC